MFYSKKSLRNLAIIKRLSKKLQLESLNSYSPISQYHFLIRDNKNIHSCVYSLIHRGAWVKHLYLFIQSGVATSRILLRICLQILSCKAIQKLPRIIQKLCIAQRTFNNFHHVTIISSLISVSGLTISDWLSRPCDFMSSDARSLHVEGKESFSSNSFCKE